MTKNHEPSKNEKGNNFLLCIKNHHKIDGKFSRRSCLVPVCPERLDPDPVCRLESLDPDQDVGSISDRNRNPGHINLTLFLFHIVQSGRVKKCFA